MSNETDFIWEKNMRQLELEFGGYITPSFETWWSENSHERRQFLETPHSREEAEKIYLDLIKKDFFKKGGFLK